MCIQSAAAAVADLCVGILLLLLLLCTGALAAAAVAVRRHAPIAKIVADLLNLIPAFIFFIQTRY